ncbi:DBH-like monooxygenase protein 1, partial [Stylophora pistillata]
MDTLHFIVEVRAMGWIASGVATKAPNSMKGYDVAIGKVEGGVGTLEDFITEGRLSPKRDNNQQDWKLTYSGENNGITKLKFYRKLNTNDDNDVVIQQGMPIYIVWAYSPANDALGQDTSSNRGKGLFPHSFDSGNFLMQWTFDDQSNKLTFHVKVKTTGWVGFGFAKVAPAQMKNYDVVVGGYDNGGYLE